MLQFGLRHNGRRVLMSIYLVRSVPHRSIPLDLSHARPGVSATRPAHSTSNVNGRRQAACRLSTNPPHGFEARESLASSSIRVDVIMSVPRSDRVRLLSSDPRAPVDDR